MAVLRQRGSGRPTHRSCFVDWPATGERDRPSPTMRSTGGRWRPWSGGTRGNVERCSSMYAYMAAASYWCAAFPGGKGTVGGGVLLGSIATSVKCSSGSAVTPTCHRTAWKAPSSAPTPRRAGTGFSFRAGCPQPVPFGNWFSPRAGVGPYETGVLRFRLLPGRASNSAGCLSAGKGTGHGRRNTSEPGTTGRAVHGVVVLRWASG